MSKQDASVVLSLNGQEYEPATRAGVPLLTYLLEYLLTNDVPLAGHHLLVVLVHLAPAPRHAPQQLRALLLRVAWLG